MRAGVLTITIGMIMFFAGLMMFYSIEIGQTDFVLKTIKSIGTFVGLSGMGVVLAGILVYLINRNTQSSQIKENFDSQT